MLEKEILSIEDDGAEADEDEEQAEIAATDREEAAIFSNKVRYFRKAENRDYRGREA